MTFNRYSLDLELSSSQYAYVADNSALSITGDISVEAWIKLEQLPSVAGSNFRILTKWKTSNLSYNLTITSAANKITWLITSDGSSNFTQVTANTALTSADVGKWIHIAVTHDVSAGAAGVTIYKNGVAQADTDDTNSATSIYDGNAQFEIGHYDGGSEYFDGLISNVRLWSDIRTSQEITDNMYKIITGTSNNLVGSWFNDANDYNDDAGTNNLTSSGSPTFSTNVPWTGANSTDWTRVYKKIDHTKVSGSADLTNFPILIKDGNLPDAMYAGLQTDGKDFRITTDSAGEVEVPFEIVAIDTTAKTCEIWAKIPTVSYTADTNLYFWYGNANAIAYDANAPFGSQAVWSAYRFVSHNGGILDSSGNTSPTNSGTSIVSGKIGDASDFTNDYINTNSDLGSYTALSLQSWIKTSNNTDFDNVLNKQDASEVSWATAVNSFSSYKLSFYLRVGTTTYEILSNSAVNTDAWIKATSIWDGSTMSMSINGSKQTATQAISGTVANQTKTFNIGRRGDNVDYFTGQLDEVRVLPTAISSDWEATEYANQNDPSTFLVDSLITALFSESVSTSDSMTRTTAKTFAEAVSAADSVLRSITKGFIESVVGAITFNTSTGRVMSESVTATDSVIRATGKTFSESFTVSDTFNSYLVIFKAFTDAVTVSDSMNRSITKVFSEAVSAIEAMARTVSKQWAETVATSDSLVTTIGMILVETVTVSVSMALVIAKAFVESISIAVSLATLVIRNFTESISSSISFNIGIAVSFVESLHISDVITRWKNGIKILWEFFYTPRGTTWTKKY